MNEFDFIRRYLAAHKQPENGVVLGIGDDAADVRPSPGCDLHLSTDMLLQGRHFFADHPPDALAHKIVAVNVSDMAAMGAKPRWMLLAAALPSSPELKRLLPYADWLSCVLDGGDDYELLFTAPPAARLRIEQIGRDCAVPLSRIGRTQPENGADRLWLRENGRLRPYTAQGFDHFA